MRFGYRQRDFSWRAGPQMPAGRFAPRETRTIQDDDDARALPGLSPGPAGARARALRSPPALVAALLLGAVRDRVARVVGRAHEVGDAALERVLELLELARVERRELGEKGEGRDGT